MTFLLPHETDVGGQTSPQNELCRWRTEPPRDRPTTADRRTFAPAPGLLHGDEGIPATHREENGPAACSRAAGPSPLQTITSHHQTASTWSFSRRCACRRACRRPRECPCRRCTGAQSAAPPAPLARRGTRPAPR